MATDETFDLSDAVETEQVVIDTVDIGGGFTADVVETVPAKSKKTSKPKSSKPKKTQPKKTPKQEKLMTATATKKPTTKKAATEKTEPATNLGGKSLKSGSTRARMFKALAKCDSLRDGLSASEIKDATGMAQNSGHLGVLLIEEVERGRIKVGTALRGEREVKVYCLSAAGRKDFDAGNVDGNAHAGHRIGQSWTKARVKAEKTR